MRKVAAVKATAEWSNRRVTFVCINDFSHDQIPANSANHVVTSKGARHRVGERNCMTGCDFTGGTKAVEPRHGDAANISVKTRLWGRRKERSVKGRARARKEGRRREKKWGVERRREDE